MNKIYNINRLVMQQNQIIQRIILDQVISNVPYLMIMGFVIQYQKTYSNQQQHLIKVRKVQQMITLMLISLYIMKMILVPILRLDGMVDSIYIDQNLFYMLLSLINLVPIVSLSYQYKYFFTLDSQQVKGWHITELPWCMQTFISFLQILGLIFSEITIQYITLIQLFIKIIGFILLIILNRLQKYNQSNFDLDQNLLNIHDLPTKKKNQKAQNLTQNSIILMNQSQSQIINQKLLDISKVKETKTSMVLNLQFEQESWNIEKSKKDLNIFVSNNFNNYLNEQHDLSQVLNTIVNDNQNLSKNLTNFLDFPSQVKQQIQQIQENQLMLELSQSVSHSDNIINENDYADYFSVECLCFFNKNGSIFYRLEILCRLNGEIYQIEKRYKQFRQLYQNMKSESYEFPRIPSSLIDNLELRSIALSQFIRRLLNNHQYFNQKLFDFIGIKPSTVQVICSPIKHPDHSSVKVQILSSEHVYSEAHDSFIQIFKMQIDTKDISIYNQEYLVHQKYTDFELLTNSLIKLKLIHKSQTSQYFNKPDQIQAFQLFVNMILQDPQITNCFETRVFFQLERQKDYL